MKVNLAKVLSVVFVCALDVLLIAFNLNKPRVFILHSYDQDYSWVRDINEGLVRVLKNRPYNIRYFYMNTKRNPGKEFKERVGESVTRMIREWNPDVLIAVDDDAQKFAAQKFVNDPKIRIIFTGVNAFPEDYGYDKAENATGMLERLPFQAFKEVFLQILPSDRRRVMHIADSSSTSVFIQKEIEALDWSPLQLTETILCDTIEDWDRAVDRANREADVLFVTHYHTIKDKNGIVIEPKKIIERTEPKLRVPAIGSWGFYVEDGGMMAVAVSPFEQGEEAAKMAVRVIEDKVSTKSIPIQKSHLFVIYIREANIRRRHLQIPGLIEAFARATNNYFEEAN